MKRIPPHINTYCTYCKASGIDMVKAIWLVSYYIPQRACEEHKGDLEVYEIKRKRLEGNYSEADYQTWMKL